MCFITQNPEMMSMYRQRVAYGQDPKQVMEYLERLDRQRDDSKPQAAPSMVGLSPEKGDIQCQIIHRKDKSFRILNSCTKRNNIKVIEPQMIEANRPEKWIDSPFGYRLDGNMYNCQLCSYQSTKGNSIQQHCMGHFPSTYLCDICGDGFHIKTQLINHKNVECQTCFKTIKHGSMNSHSCNIRFN
jgi:hypothetical protein